MTTPMSPLCLSCQRWFAGGPSCLAFDRIPDDIWLHGGDHRESRDGEPAFLLVDGAEDDLRVWLQQAGQLK